MQVWMTPGGGGGGGGRGGSRKEGEVRGPRTILQSHTHYMQVWMTPGGGGGRGGSRKGGEVRGPRTILQSHTHYMQVWMTPLLATFPLQKLYTTFPFFPLLGTTHTVESFNFVMHV